MFPIFSVLIAIESQSLKANSCSGHRFMLKAFFFAYYVPIARESYCTLPKKDIKCSYSLTAVPSTITIMPATVQCWSCLLGLSISISICEMLWEKRANARCPELENYSIPLFDVGLWCKLILTLCLFHILIPTTNLLLHFHKCTIAVSCFKGKRSCM